MKTTILTLFAALSAFGGEQWFDADIKNYSGWPKDGGDFVVEAVGTWKGTACASLVGTDGERALAFLAREDSLRFAPATMAPVAEGKTVNVESAVTLDLWALPETLPTPDADAKYSFAVSAFGGEPGYFGYMKDPAGETNVWQRLAGAQPVDGETVIMRVETRVEDGVAVVRYLVNGTALTSPAGMDWNTVALPPESTEITQVAFKGMGTICSLTGESEPIPLPPTRWEGTNVTERVTLVPGDYEFANATFAGGIRLKPGDYKIKNDGSKSVNAAAFIDATGANITFTGKGRLNLAGTGSESLLTANSLTVSNGVITIDFTSETAKTAAISLTGNFALADRGKVEMTLDGVQPYGIELTEKKMTADFTDTSAVVAMLGGTKASAFKFKGSDVVTFAGGTMEAEIVGTDAKVVNGGTLVFEDGYEVAVTGGDGATDATVFESGKTLTVNGGVFEIAVPAAGSQIFTTADDPTEKDLTLTINGGTFTLLAGDDCVKSAGNDAVSDPESENTKRDVVITGGNFYGVSIGNDVIDSNGNLIITGGNILCFTTAVEDDGNGSAGLDVNAGCAIEVTGGNVIAIGGPNSSFHYEGGLAYTADGLAATDFSDKFLKLTGAMNGQETHVWAKLPAFEVGTISLFAYTFGIDPTVAPTASSETPDPTYATGFHDLYIDDLKPVDYNGGEALSPYATESISGADGAIGWKGYAFAEPAMIVGVTVTSSSEKPLAIYGAAIQGANAADFSDAVNIAWVEIDQYFKGGAFVVPLEDVHGPYRYVRIVGEIGEDGKDVAGLEFYGLKSSGEIAPRSAPEVTAFGSTDGKVSFTIVADPYVPQVYRVERTMVAGDGDEEAFLPLGLVGGESFTWTDAEVTPFTSYRVQGVNANGTSEWTTFAVEPKKVIAGDARPTFSVKPGAYAESQSLEITYSDPAAEIWYTTDGSEPVNEETATCHRYTGAITLAARDDAPANLGKIPTASAGFTAQHPADGFREPTADQPYVTTIRAKAFKDGATSPHDAYGTWLIGENATRHGGLRVVSLQTESANLFSDATGIMVPGDWYNNRPPEVGANPNWDGHPYANFYQGERAWERLVNLELIEGDGSEGFNQQFGVRARGNYTRAVPKKSMTVFSRAEYGAKNLKYRLFGDEPDHNKFKRFLIRSGGNDWNGTTIKDGIAQRIFRSWTRTCTQGIEPSALYINGEYWGLYHLRHGYSKKHFEDWCGVDGDNLDWIKIDPASALQYEVQEGDLVEFVKLREFLNNHDFATDAAAWQQAKDLVDLDDMIDFHIIGMFINNADWVGNGNGNNAGYWRERKAGAKWRLHVYDCDSGFDSASGDRIRQTMTKDDGKYSPPLFRKLSANAEFQRRFVTRYADLLNTALKSERTRELLKELADEVRPEIGRTVARWANMGSVQNWEKKVNGIDSFFDRRPGYVWEHLLSDFPEVTGRTNVLSLAKTGEGEIKLNTIESGTDAGKFALPFTGAYFENTPITLTAKPAEGQSFAKWIVDGVETSTEKTIELSLTADTSVEAVFVKSEESAEKKFLRLHSFDGITADGAKGDTGEWIVLTNLSNEATLDLQGVNLVFQKMKGGVPDGVPKCAITLGAGLTVAPGGAIRLDQFDYSSSGWSKITNGDLRYSLADATGAIVQGFDFTQKTFEGYYGDSGNDGPGGAFYLAATTYGAESETFVEVAYPTADEPVVKPEEGTIAKGKEAGTWVVTPVEGTNAVTVANLPEGEVIIVPSVIEKVTGVPDGQIRVVNHDVESGRSFDVTAAFTITDGAIELDATATVTVQTTSGEELIPVKPVLSDASDAEKPFEVLSETTSVGAKTIPGLTYELRRAGEPAVNSESYQRVGEPVQATTTRTLLVDPFAGGKPPRAFYVIRVTR